MDLCRCKVLGRPPETIWAPMQANTSAYLEKPNLPPMTKIINRSQLQRKPAGNRPQTWTGDRLTAMAPSGMAAASAASGIRRSGG
jgi:hypothetical protein